MVFSRSDKKGQSRGKNMKNINVNLQTEIRHDEFEILPHTAILGISYFRKLRVRYSHIKTLFVIKIS